MSSGEDWLLRPVRANMCRFESLLDCTLDLDDVATMNEALDVEEVNKDLYEDWRRKNSK
jgi:hypothetical protein